MLLGVIPLIPFIPVNNAFDLILLIDLVLEGQESLRKEMHGIRDDLSEQIDGVDAVLKAHRADTEVHRSYGIRED